MRIKQLKQFTLPTKDLKFVGFSSSSQLFRRGFPHHHQQYSHSYQLITCVYPFVYPSKSRVRLFKDWSFIKLWLKEEKSEMPSQLFQMKINFRENIVPSEVKIKSLQRYQCPQGFPKLHEFIFINFLAATKDLFCVDQAIYYANSSFRLLKEVSFESLWPSRSRPEIWPHLLKNENQKLDSLQGENKLQIFERGQYS